MKRYSKRIVIGIAAVLMVLFIFSTPVLASEETVVGRVTDEFQIVTDDGDAYEVADTDKGDEVINNVGKVIEATGTVTEDGGLKIIEIISFKVVEE